MYLFVSDRRIESFGAHGSASQVDFRWTADDVAMHVCSAYNMTTGLYTRD